MTTERKKPIDKPSLRRVSRVDLARTFGATVSDVDKWVEMGCPYIKRAASKGYAWIFDTADVMNWRLEIIRTTGRPATPLR